jgi:surfeit locus 1 family protein
MFGFFANRRFQPKWIPTLVAAVLVPGLVSLGYWQLSRAEDKRALIGQFAEGGVTTQDLTATNVLDLPQLQSVIVRGRYDNAHQVLLDNMPSELNNKRSRPGYHVLTPLLSDNGEIVMINRGWVPLGATREQLPLIDVLEQPRTLRGRLADLPRAGIQMSTIIDSTAWPKVLNFPTITELTKLYSKPLLPKIVLLDPDQPDGMLREWSKRYSFGDFGPERHLAYAVQWFGLAVTLMILYLLSQFRRPQDTITS